MNQRCAATAADAQVAGIRGRRGSGVQCDVPAVATGCCPISAVGCEIAGIRHLLGMQAEHQTQQIWLKNGRLEEANFLGMPRLT